MSLLRRGLAALLLPFLAALPALLSSCGGSAEVTINVGGGTGPAALSVAVTGLPAGTAADLTVTGPAGFRTTAQLDWKIASPGSVLSFGEDAQHEVYLLADPFTSATSGKVYRVAATAAQP